MHEHDQDQPFQYRDENWLYRRQHFPWGVVLAGATIVAVAAWIAGSCLI